ncbi:hypothetical protein A0H81_10335 [Grifola frondosa]|uniref:Uncharacterized protein n=1 Tax=Grifola frondosa TaxID=5627 RepID=A0A1C7LZP4_GRIFR|nr:hypothetical protein A0H81_10335 [Grifola frondosa]
MREKKPIGIEEQDIKAALNSVKGGKAPRSADVNERTKLDEPRMRAGVKRRERARVEYEILKRKSEERMKKEFMNEVKAAKRDVEDMKKKHNHERQQW